MSTIVQSHLTGELPDPHLISWFQLDAGAGYIAARIASYTGERGPDVCFNRLRSLTSSKLRAYWKRVVETSLGLLLALRRDRLLDHEVRPGEQRLKSQGVMNSVSLGRKMWTYFDGRQNHL